MPTPRKKKPSGGQTKPLSRVFNIYSIATKAAKIQERERKAVVKSRTVTEPVRDDEDVVPEAQILAHQKIPMRGVVQGPSMGCGAPRSTPTNNRVRVASRAPSEAPPELDGPPYWVARSHKARQAPS